MWKSNRRSMLPSDTAQVLGADTEMNHPQIQHMKREKEGRAEYLQRTSKSYVTNHTEDRGDGRAH
jgi:hypothetical protein